MVPWGNHGNGLIARAVPFDDSFASCGIEEMHVTWIERNGDRVTLASVSGARNSYVDNFGASDGAHERERLRTCHLDVVDYDDDVDRAATWSLFGKYEVVGSHSNSNTRLTIFD